MRQPVIFAPRAANVKVLQAFYPLRRGRRRPARRAQGGQARSFLCWSDRQPNREQTNDTRREIMKTYILGTLAALTLSLGVTSNASADWRYRERVRFEHGRRIVYQERYW